MKTGGVPNAVDLWEAWIDVCAGEQYALYVIGDICTGRSKTAPVLVKKKVQGADKSHLILELLSFGSSNQGRLAEVGYTEHLTNIRQYHHVSICAGEDIIAYIPDIEVLY